MKRILHLVTDRHAEPLDDVLARQRERADATVVEFDLTTRSPDYAKLLEAVFDADAVAVW